MTYPRSRNGWIDDGSPIKASNRRDTCPNCGSSDYRETLSMEKCNSCGLVCDYWGGGTNGVYENYLQKHYDEQERARDESFRRQYEADWGEPYKG